MHIDQNKNKGFTLVELVIVVAILAILVGILAPAYSKYVERSAESTDLENVRTAYGEVMIAVEIEEEKDVLKVVPLKQKQKFHEQRYNHKNRTHCKKFLKNNILLSNAIDIIYKIQEKSKTPQNNLPHLSTPDFVSN